MRLSRWGLVAVVAIAAAAHGAGLRNGFVHDDHSAILDNPVVQGPLDPGRLLATDFWGRAPGAGPGTWRPLPVLSFWVDRHAGGLFHLTSLVWHAAASVLLVLAAARRTGRPRVALAAGLLFAALAVNSEAVDGLVGRADVMAAALAFLAWWLPGPAAALPLFAALLCKESALVLPVFLLAAERPTARRVLALAAAVAAYLSLRHACFGGLDVVTANAGGNPLVDAGLGTRALTALHLFALALRLMLAPVALSADYGFAEILPDRALSFDVVAGGAALAAVLAAAWLARRRDAAISWGLLLLLVGFAPLTHLARPLPAIFAERLLYLPAAGLALALAAAGSRLRGAPILLLLLVAGNAARSFVRAGDWHDDATLWSASVAATPRSAAAWTNLGVARLDRRDLDGALDALGRAVEIAPGWAVPRTFAGVALSRRGDAPRAEEELRAAVALDPELVPAAVNLAAFLAGRHRAAEARALLAPFVARHPDAEPARRLLEKLSAPRSGPAAPD